jgi:hypothetical protein
VTEERSAHRNRTQAPGRERRLQAAPLIAVFDEEVTMPNSTFMRVLVIGVVFIATAPTYAQSPVAAGPDWSGAWVVPFATFAQENGRQRQPGDPASPPLMPHLAALLSQQTNDNPQRRPSNAERCLPNGMPNVMRYPFAIEFLFTPGRVTMLLEQDSMIRRIYTDGRTHSVDPDPSYAGESIGRWEGETLVVTTTAISASTELMASIRTSGQATVTERIFLRDRDHLQIDSVVVDPVALREPWRRTHVYDRREPHFFERVCLDNNRDRDGGEPDLTPPAP